MCIHCITWKHPHKRDLLHTKNFAKVFLEHIVVSEVRANMCICGNITTKETYGQYRLTFK